jgi:hypothetical protein
MSDLDLDTNSRRSKEGAKATATPADVGGRRSIVVPKASGCSAAVRTNPRRSKEGAKATVESADVGEQQSRLESKAMAATAAARINPRRSSQGTKASRPPADVGERRSSPTQSQCWPGRRSHLYQFTSVHSRRESHRIRGRRERAAVQGLVESHPTRGCCSHPSSFFKNTSVHTQSESQSTSGRRGRAAVQSGLESQ